jgi:hypothetical protein
MKTKKGPISSAAPNIFFLNARTLCQRFYLYPIKRTSILDILRILICALMILRTLMEPGQRAENWCPSFDRGEFQSCTCGSTDENRISTEGHLYPPMLPRAHSSLPSHPDDVSHLHSPFYSPLSPFFLAALASNVTNSTTDNLIMTRSLKKLCPMADPKEDVRMCFPITVEFG